MAKIGNSSLNLNKGHLKIQNTNSKQKESLQQSIFSKQPVSVLKQKRKFTHKSLKPSVHFDYAQRVKDDDGNIFEEPVPWMKKPNSLQPKGLECLKTIDFVVVETCISSLVSENKYVIKGEKGFEEYKIPNSNVVWNCNLSYILRNTNGEQVFVASEDIWRNEKTSVLKVLDDNENETMDIIHEIHTCACCWCAGIFSACSHQVMIQAPPGNHIGKITQSSSCLGLIHLVFDDQNNIIAEIKGTNPIFNDNQNFKVKMKNDTNNCTDGEFYFNNTKSMNEKHSNSAIKFPTEIDEKTKAILIGAYFMIDNMFYESSVIVKPDEIGSILKKNKK